MPLNNIFKIIREAIKAVPQMRFAMGVAGLFAVLALVKYLHLSYRIAFLGSIGLFILMGLLVLFSHWAKQSRTHLKLPLTIINYSTVILGIAVVVQLMTAVFWGVPIDLRHLLPINHKIDHSVEHVILGEVVNEHGTPVKQAWVYVRAGSYKTSCSITGSDGKFYIKTDSIPDISGCSVYFGKESVSDHKILYSREYQKLTLSMPEKKSLPAKPSLYIDVDYLPIDVKKKIAGLMGRSHAGKSDHRVTFCYDETRLEKLDDGDYRYGHNGTVTININGSLCGAIEGFVLVPSSGWGKPKEVIEKELFDQIGAYVGDHYELIAKKIEQCIK